MAALQYYDFAILPFLISIHFYFFAIASILRNRYLFLGFFQEPDSVFYADLRLECEYGMS
jgi:hypothetical protein